MGPVDPAGSNPDASPAEPGDAERGPGSGGLPLWLIVAVGVGSLAVAAAIIAAVAGPLAGLVSPPDPPIFEPARLVEHRGVAYGVDEWDYSSEATGCEIYAWYQTQAESCALEPLVSCPSGRTDPAQGGASGVGYCQGTITFGEFSANWKVSISDGYNTGDGRTHFSIAREVNWMPRPD